MPIHWSNLLSRPGNDQLFTHIDADGRNTVYAASMLRDFCITRRAPIARIPIETKFATLAMEVRGLEPARLRRAMRTKLYQPLLYCHQSDGTSLLVDGSHSYVAMHAKGILSAEAYLIPRLIWWEFVVIGLPDETEDTLLRSKSGVRP